MKHFFVCLFVKKANFQGPVLVKLVQTAISDVEKLREPEKEDICGGDQVISDALLAFVCCVITLIFFSYMDAAPEPFLISQKKVAVYPLRNPLEKTKSLDNSTPVNNRVKTENATLKRSGSLRFRRGFLMKRKSRDFDYKNSKKVIQFEGSNSLVDSIDQSQSPVAIDEGNISHVFKLFSSSGKSAAIFKPYNDSADIPESDKENINDLSSSKLIYSSKKHVMNEVAAFEFQKVLPAQIYAAVPETSYAEFPRSIFSNEGSSGVIRGSVQQYIEGENAEDFGPGLFSVNDVHKIGILDLLILNCDRHAGNLLFQRESKKLIPIDHALSFPEIEYTVSTTSAMLSRDAADIDLALKHVNFGWLMYSQSKKKFSHEIVEAIKSLSVESLMKTMSSLGMTIEQKLAIYASANILKIGATEYNKTLYEIGKIVQRSGMREQASIFEQMVASAISNVDVERLKKGEVGQISTFNSRIIDEIRSHFSLQTGI